jgi:AraC-like DNA-binding protein
MKPISFSIPNTGEESIRIQIDQGAQFYPKFHAHQETQISWIVKGSGNLLVEENIIPFEENSIFILGPGMPHVFKTDPVLVKHVHAVGLYFDPFNKMEAVFDLPECAYLIPLIDRIKLGGILEGALVKVVSEYLLSMHKLEGIHRLSLFLEMMHYLSAKSTEINPINNLSPKSLSGNIDERIQRVIEFSFTHYQKNIKIEEVAALINMSTPSFCRFFKWSTGKSYINYLNGLRVTQACQLLRSTILPISEIAYQCGFNYVQHFNRTFKSFKRLTPKEFRGLRF